MARLFCILGIFLLVNSAISHPVQDEDTAEEATTTETVPNNETQNLYVIKSVVYEIGILTDGDDDDLASNETHEQVDVSFFDPAHNGSFIDLSNIPLPIQTNVSGVAVTGLLPADLGSISLNDDGTATYNGSVFPTLPKKQVRITHNISTINKDKSSSILSGLPQILGLDNFVKLDDDNNNKDNSTNADQGKESSTDKENGTSTNQGKETNDDGGDDEDRNEKESLATTDDSKELKVDGLLDDEDEGISS